MSPRRHRRNGGEPRQPPRVVSEAVESWPDGDWVVRSVPAGGPGRVYRCPGCDQEIPSSVSHLVCWPVDAGAEERRHWHLPCWRARGRRGPRIARPGRHRRF